MAKARRRSGKGLIVVALGAGALAGGAGYADSQSEQKVVPGVTVAGVDVSGLTKTAAAERLEAWWKEARNKPIKVSCDYTTGALPQATAEELGVVFSAQDQAASLPYEGLIAQAWRQVRGEAVRQISKPLMVTGDASLADAWAKKTDSILPSPSPARATLKAGAVDRKQEVPGLEVDVTALAAAAAQAVVDGDSVKLPLVETQKRVPDSELSKIVEVVGAFSTRYSEGNRNRSANIKLAARQINGTVLMPGEKFSFNETLGRRTAAKGFLEAGVYVSGRRETDIGGGICQVSTTLYNAALLAGLEVVTRSPHSLSVPYVPLGRDAAVSFPNPDLAFVNNTGQAVAVAAEAGKGSIRFSILGTKVPGQTVEIAQSGHQSWSRGIKYVDDPSLPPGRQRIEDRGGLAHSVAVTRIFKQNGEVAKRESLGTSRYSGGPRIVAINRRPAPPKPATPVVKPETVPVSKPTDAASVVSPED